MFDSLVIESLVLFIFLATKLISFLKKQENNAPLWSSVFEGVTMGLVNLDEHKNSDTKIDRKAKRDGKEELPNNFIDPESMPAPKKD
ncbi:MAG: hypothetical protein JKY29_01040 [Gammaproteobacteria bacterium]|nr:hypothetical protein [Gammaproteobacteria bacterium]